jgi:hypothetical protein
VSDIHAAAGNGDDAAAARREYDRLASNDDKLLDQIEALQESKAQTQKSKQQK